MSTPTQEAVGRFPVRGDVRRRSAAERADVMSRLSFGVDFTDHMARALWTPAEGWHDRELVAFGPLQLSPATSVLHYGQEVFEGLKAYRHADGTIWAFRPHENARRFNRSARRLAMPELPEEDFVASIQALVSADRDWVPTAEGATLYLRPFAFASEPFLGVRSSHQVTYLVIASPVGPYFRHGFRPVSIWVAREHHRAGPGGTGAAKTAGNYAASLLPQEQAYAQGCEQVCFLDAATNTLVEELGGMNLFVVDADGTVRTPGLGKGTILEGVTRGSILQLLQEQGRTVVEGSIRLDELLDGIRSGNVAEVFACGTAAVVTPIGRLAGTGFDLTIADGEPGQTTSWLHRTLTDIQFGRAEDSHGWLHRLV